jgi:hypothetical protein
MCPIITLNQIDYKLNTIKVLSFKIDKKLKKLLLILIKNFSTISNYFKNFSDKVKVISDRNKKKVNNPVKPNKITAHE